MRPSVLRISISYLLFILMLPAFAQRSDAVEKSIKSLKKQFTKEHYVLFGDGDVSLDEAIRKHVERCQMEGVDEICVTATSSKKRLLPVLLLARAAKEYATRQEVTIKQKSEHYISSVRSDFTTSEVEHFTSEVNGYAENLFKEEISLSFIVYRTVKVKQSDGSEVEVLEAKGFYLIDSETASTSLTNAIEQAFAESVYME